jgi:hypothetical protein
VSADPLRLLGTWLRQKTGVTLSTLEDVPIAARQIMDLRENGVAEIDLPDGASAVDGQPSAKWDVVDESHLVISVPVAPMPDVGVFDWTYEDVWYRIESISANRLVLDSRPNGGEVFLVFRRIG